LRAHDREEYPPRVSEKALHDVTRAAQYANGWINTLERRETTRYSVQALVEFRWVSEEGALHQGRGVTRDICAKGMFVYSDSPPAEKADVEIDVSFRPVIEGAVSFQLGAKAVVIRMEPAETPGISHGFAVLNKTSRLHPMARPDIPRNRESEEPE
jgi:hypothetical protein